MARGYAGKPALAKLACPSSTANPKARDQADNTARKTFSSTRRAIVARTAERQLKSDFHKLKDVLEAS